MKKMTYIIIGIVAVFVLVGILVYKNTNFERECRKEAEQTYLMTARVDRDNATEESYYHCLIKKGVNPYKYKWQGNEISEHARKYTESMVNYYKGKKQEEYLFQLIGKLSSLHEVDLNTITKILGFSFKETEKSNEFTLFLESNGLDPINYADLRISRNNPQKVFLVLELSSSVNISEKEILKKYPNGNSNITSIDAFPSTNTYSLSNQGIEISFNFDEKDILRSIGFSLENK